MALEVRLTATLADLEIADSQTITAGNSFDLTNTTLGDSGLAQQLTFTPTPSASIDVTITGTDADGNPTVEILNEVSAAAHVSEDYFATVSSIVVNTGTATATVVEWAIETGGITKSIPVNSRSSPFGLSITSTPFDGVTSTLGTGTIEYTVFDPEDDYSDIGFSNSALWVDVEGLQNASYVDDFLSGAVTAVRGEIFHVSLTSPIKWLFVFLQGDTYT